MRTRFAAKYKVFTFTSDSRLRPGKGKALKFVFKSYCCPRSLEGNYVSVDNRLNVCMYLCTKPPGVSYAHSHILVFFPYRDRPVFHEASLRGASYTYMHILVFFPTVMGELHETLGALRHFTKLLNMKGLCKHIHISQSFFLLMWLYLAKSQGLEEALKSPCAQGLVKPLFLQGIP